MRYPRACRAVVAASALLLAATAGLPTSYAAQQVTTADLDATHSLCPFTSGTEQEGIYESCCQDLKTSAGVNVCNAWDDSIGGGCCSVSVYDNGAFCFGRSRRPSVLDDDPPTCNSAREPVKLFSDIDAPECPHSRLTGFSAADSMAVGGCCDELKTTSGETLCPNYGEDDFSCEEEGAVCACCRIFLRDATLRCDNRCVSADDDVSGGTTAPTGTRSAPSGTRSAPSTDFGSSPTSTPGSTPPGSVSSASPRTTAASPRSTTTTTRRKPLRTTRVRRSWKRRAIAIGASSAVLLVVSIIAGVVAFLCLRRRAARAQAAQPPPGQAPMGKSMMRDNGTFDPTAGAPYANPHQHAQYSAPQYGAPQYGAPQYDGAPYGGGPVAGPFAMHAGVPQHQWQPQPPPHSGSASGHAQYQQPSWPSHAPSEGSQPAYERQPSQGSHHGAMPVPSQAGSVTPSH